jgi:hypothetical protein
VTGTLLVSLGIIQTIRCLLTIKTD